MIVSFVNIFGAVSDRSITEQLLGIVIQVHVPQTASHLTDDDSPNDNNFYNRYEGIGGTG